MPTSSLPDWLAQFDHREYLWYIKRLSGNDTLANGSHQAGPYTPKSLVFELFPHFDTSTIENPDANFQLSIDSHDDQRTVRLVYYNNSRTTNNGSRDEARLTGLGGRASALLDPGNTGSIAIFVFRRETVACHVWVARNQEEEEIIQDLVGPVEPVQTIIRRPLQGQSTSLAFGRQGSCRLTAAELPPEWLHAFPSGTEIIRKALELRRSQDLDPDKRLIRRRICEFELFQAVEEAVYSPDIRRGFESIESFLVLAQTILQSRKARSGNSLELHAKTIFEEEGLRNGHEFQYKPITDQNRRPDFIFPSQAAYNDPAFPSERLRFLGVKTTCRDRWRQILNEASRIPRKHLLTVQEGVSEAQFEEMVESGVQLVVPAGLHKSYPERVRPQLQSLEDFISELRELPH